MIAGAITPETIIRLWLLGACTATAAVILGALLVSHAAEKAFRDAAERNHPTQPTLVPIAPWQDIGARDRQSVVGHHEALHENAPTIDAERSNVLAFRPPKHSARAG